VKSVKPRAHKVAIPPMLTPVGCLASTGRFEVESNCFYVTSGT